MPASKALQIASGKLQTFCLVRSIAWQSRESRLAIRDERRAHSAGSFIHSRASLLCAIYKSFLELDLDLELDLNRDSRIREWATRKRKWRDKGAKMRDKEVRKETIEEEIASVFELTECCFSSLAYLVKLSGI